MMNLSMDQLAERTSHAVTKQSISKYEKAKMMPKGATLSLIAKALGISVEYFNGTSMQLDTLMLRNAFKNEIAEDDLMKLETQLSFWAEQYIRAERAADMKIPFVNPLCNLIVDDIDPGIFGVNFVYELYRLNIIWHLWRGIYNRKTAK